MNKVVSRPTAFAKTDWLVKRQKQKTQSPLLQELVTGKTKEHVCLIYEPFTHLIRGREWMRLICISTATAMCDCSRDASLTQIMLPFISVLTSFCLLLFGLTGHKEHTDLKSCWFFIWVTCYGNQPSEVSWGCNEGLLDMTPASLMFRSDAVRKVVRYREQELWGKLAVLIRVWKSHFIIWANSTFNTN